MAVSLHIYTFRIPVIWLTILIALLVRIMRRARGPTHVALANVTDVVGGILWDTHDRATARLSCRVGSR
jgi:hypothetical protein